MPSLKDIQRKLEDGDDLKDDEVVSGALQLGLKLGLEEGTSVAMLAQLVEAAARFKEAGGGGVDDMRDFIQMLKGDEGAS